MDIVFPKTDFKIKVVDGVQVIWDDIRNKWVRLTPEEWVRQNFIQVLQQNQHFPTALMAVEKEIKLGELKKRCDIIQYKNSEPWLIVECKETDVPLTEKVWMQILRYNMSIPAPYLVITNGVQTLGWKRQDDKLHPLETLPYWSQD